MYKKITETKVVRITHEVSFSEGTRAIDILDSLRSVPPTSKLIDVDTDDNNGAVALLFREEKEEAK